MVVIDPRKNPVDASQFDASQSMLERSSVDPTQNAMNPDLTHAPPSLPHGQGQYPPENDELPKKMFTKLEGNTTLPPHPDDVSLLLNSQAMSCAGGGNPTWQYWVDHSRHQLQPFGPLPFSDMNMPYGAGHPTAERPLSYCGSYGPTQSSLGCAPGGNCCPPPVGDYGEVYGPGRPPMATQPRPVRDQAFADELRNMSTSDIERTLCMLRGRLDAEDHCAPPCAPVPQVCRQPCDGPPYVADIHAGLESSRPMMYTGRQFGMQGGPTPEEVLLAQYREQLFGRVGGPGGSYGPPCYG